MKEILEQIANRQNLSREQAHVTLQRIIDNELNATQAGAILMGLRQKGETAEEINGFLDVLNEHKIKVKLKDEKAVDVCGTGGDGKGTFNVSTAVSFVLAAGGVTVAKHGNRSISSKAGSADVLEALGANIQMTPEQAKQCADEIGLTFFYAPSYHPAMKAIAPHRKSLSIRTVFNMLGPLLNPAGVKRQLIGTFNFSSAEMIAKVLQERQHEHAFVIHAYDGLDEISPFSETAVFEVSAKRQKIRAFSFNKFTSQGRHKDLLGENAKHNAQKIRAIFSGKKGADRDIVVFNAAFGFLVADKVTDLNQGRRLAEEMIDSGLALKKLNQFVHFTNSFN